MIRKLYGQHYHIEVLHVDTDDQGHDGTSRERLYCVLNHMERTQQIIDPKWLYRKVTATIQEHVQTCPADYLVSSRTELLMDAADVARTRGKRVRRAPKLCSRFACSFFDATYHMACRNFRTLLLCLNLY